jgi:hypothetical protein
MVVLFGVAFAAGCDREDIALRKGEVEAATACGGFAGASCPDGLVCVDDPSDDCTVENGGADCAGICVEEQKPGPECGGFAGASCPDGLVCVDDPSDDCTVGNGGADCAGICVAAEKPRKDRKPKKDRACKDKDRDYVGEDPATCAAIRFQCADGQVAFFDECGCGCVTP